jgi:hypothetical protein
VVGHGISAEHVNSQNHRVSSYHPYIVELLENGFFIHADIEEIRDGAFLRLIEKKGVKSILNVPIKTLNGKIIGILGVDYVKDSMPEIQSESEAQQAASDDPVFLLKNQARAIAGYLV